LTQRRGSILDHVLPAFTSMRGRLNSTDRATLDQHAQFIRDMETTLGTSSASHAAASCSPPTQASIPNWRIGDTSCGAKDNLTVPVIINMLVQALACDITRSASVMFANDGCNFGWMFPSGTSPFGNISQHTWHDGVHDAALLTAPLNSD